MSVSNVQGRLFLHIVYCYCLCGLKNILEYRSRNYHPRTAGLPHSVHVCSEPYIIGTDGAKQQAAVFSSYNSPNSPFLFMHRELHWIIASAMLAYLLIVLMYVSQFESFIQVLCCVLLCAWPLQLRPSFEHVQLPPLLWLYNFLSMVVSSN